MLLPDRLGLPASRNSESEFSRHQISQTAVRTPLDALLLPGSESSPERKLIRPGISLGKDVAPNSKELLGPSARDSIQINKSVGPRHINY
jgi:hypothetical protein